MKSMEQINGAGDIGSFSPQVINEKQQHALLSDELGTSTLDNQSLLLLGGERQRLYRSSLSAREMESLIALCDTFLPSIDVPGATTNAALFKFYRTSASMAGTPQRVGGLMSERLRHPKLWLIRLVLWLLSTWIGSFILGGRGVLCSKFPYFQTFPQMSQQKREEIVMSWSLSYFYLVRMLFKTMKLLTLFVFFTQVDDENEEKNVSWEAIGYTGPPEQDFITNTKAKARKLEPSSTQTGKENPNIHEIELYGPLHKGVIDMKKAKNDDSVVDTLSRLGIPASVLHSEMKPKSRRSLLSIQCDAVVIGSGSGGGVVAGVLAKAGYKVVVIEKGNYYARNNLTLVEGSSMDEMYLSGGLIATDDMGVFVLAGSNVGGGSTINWSASIRNPQHVLKEWCNDHRLQQLFGSELYQEAMDVVCEKMGVQNEVQEEGFNNAVLRKGCRKLGYPVSNIHRNSPSDHYCGWCRFGCKDGRKKGTAETWLVDLVNSESGVILSGCEATKVLQNRGKTERNRASGVVFEFERQGGKDIGFVESKVTIVACGALCTPKLLKQSGLKNRNIGNNLHLHPVAMAWGYYPDSMVFDEMPEREKKSYEGGIMTAMSSVVADMNGSGYGALIQTPALHPGMFSILMPWVSSTDIKHRMSRFSKTAHVFALARDKGSGTVNAEAPNSISYRMEDADEHNLKIGLEKSLRILAAAGAAEIGTHHFKGESLIVNKASLDEFEVFVKEESLRGLRDVSSAICSAHQMGSCRMGVDPEASVVNQMAETWEVEGLFVADTSVFPTALGVNPMVTVQAIAYCTAQSILQLLKTKKLDP